MQVRNRIILAAAVIIVLVGTGLIISMRFIACSASSENILSESAGTSSMMESGQLNEPQPEPQPKPEIPPRPEPEPETGTYNPEFVMDCDYYISGEKLYFTRNHGEVIIPTDLTPEELADTLDFYLNGLYLPPTSYFITPDETMLIAYFHGDLPDLKASFDNGETWETLPLLEDFFGGPVTKRVIGFVTPDFGYAALGTDWTPSRGEGRRCYITRDAGQTWEEKALPLSGTSSTLMDLTMADEEVGLMAFEEGMQTVYPLMFGTDNAVDSYFEVLLPYEDLPEEVQYLTYIDSLVYEDGMLVLTMGQGDSGKAKAVFEAIDIRGKWKYVDSYEGVIHTVG